MFSGHKQLVLYKNQYGSDWHLSRELVHEYAYGIDVYWEYGAVYKHKISLKALGDYRFLLMHYSMLFSYVRIGNSEPRLFLREREREGVREREKEREREREGERESIQTVLLIHI